MSAAIRARIASGPDWLYPLSGQGNRVGRTRRDRHSGNYFADFVQYNDLAAENISHCAVCETGQAHQHFVLSKGYTPGHHVGAYRQPPPVICDQVASHRIAVPQHAIGVVDNVVALVSIERYPGQQFPFIIKPGDFASLRGDGLAIMQH